MKGLTLRMGMLCMLTFAVFIGQGDLALAKSDNANLHKDWKLKYHENFNRSLLIDEAPWVIDNYGDQSPWNVDHLDDDGEFYQIKGGENFEEQLSSFNLLRKRVDFGKDGWLTAEVATRDYNKDGTPDTEASFKNVKLDKGKHAAELSTSFDSGLIIRSTEELPSEYRVEYVLRGIDFGGKRDGSFDYDGKHNGYTLDERKSNFPWKRSGDFSGEPSHQNQNFGEVTKENGYYFLSIMDYANPAPHNNVFIHNHRKVGMDAYNVSGSWASSYGVCNPDTGDLYSQTSEESSNNAINSIFFAGDTFRDPSIGYNSFMFETDCGSFSDKDSPYSIVSNAEIQPELMPEESYKFAIERNETGYVMEMTGNFKYSGYKTLRYERNFVEDDRPIWHYNNSPEEYDGEYNSSLTFTGPYGSYSVEQWPDDSAYPDYFILGIPHLNYYEGSAVIDDIKLYVPKEG
ncbi:hypothetical protein [Anaerobacillus sp. 1_MG-2023]|uniref:hypothetical protein n=1 Tax=Anaerobacillus sp. 1_MG-2023 TaxID=3062655 RepID=UPI0026E15F99|nr:hypothetical protein [Anaerobacillus sp. 1_MG-2023]MDO6657795.1 hypothetical protein [Anaerobacillus sp. 1_MG-2023]